MIGFAAPNFNVTDINWNKYSLSDLKGKVIVLNFWFVECFPVLKKCPN